MNLVALELDRVLFYLILRLKKVDSSIDISKKKKKIAFTTKHKNFDVITYIYTQFLF